VRIRSTFSWPRLPSSTSMASLPLRAVTTAGRRAHVSGVWRGMARRAPARPPLTLVAAFLQQLLDEEERDRVVLDEQHAEVVLQRAVLHSLSCRASGHVPAGAWCGCDCCVVGRGRGGGRAGKYEREGRARA
jgi:hypothetical protein